MQKEANTPSPIRAIGLMSGSSLDGLDVCLCEFTQSPGRWSFKVIASKNVRYSANLKYKLNDAMYLSGRKLMLLDANYGIWIGQQVNEFTNGVKKKIDVIGSHGHTVFHDPRGGYTTQIGSGAHIAATAGIPCVSQFRSGDIARGGEGAPLVPIGDELLFGQYNYCLNLGGFANVSYRKVEQRVAFDICPANMLLNYLASLMGMEYDNQGAMGRKGEVNLLLLDNLNRLPFYRGIKAKSLNREWFLSEILPLIDKDSISLEDKFRTAYEHISMQVAGHLKSKSGESVLITGGGARNAFLVELIEQKCKASIVVPEEELVDFKEAIIFAFLSVLYLDKTPSCLASATGAKEDSIGGCLYY